MKSLVIVESPTKAKTIQKFLGSDFVIKSSFGHVRDLPKRELGVDVDKNFEAKYVVPTKAKKVIAELKNPNALALISKFTKIGILKETTGKKRNRAFTYENYVKLFE